MASWIVVLLALISAVFGAWIVWRKKITARVNESDATRAKASFMLGLSLTVMYLVGTHV